MHKFLFQPYLQSYLTFDFAKLILDYPGPLAFRLFLKGLENAHARFSQRDTSELRDKHMTLPACIPGGLATSF